MQVHLDILLNPFKSTNIYLKTKCHNFNLILASGLVMLTGQLADGVSTTFVSYHVVKMSILILIFLSKITCNCIHNILPSYIRLVLQLIRLPNVFPFVAGAQTSLLSYFNQSYILSNLNEKQGMIIYDRIQPGTGDERVGIYSARSVLPFPFLLFFYLACLAGRCHYHQNWNYHL